MLTVTMKLASPYYATRYMRTNILTITCTYYYSLSIQVPESADLKLRFREYFSATKHADGRKPSLTNQQKTLRNGKMNVYNLHVNGPQMLVMGAKQTRRRVLNGRQDFSAPFRGNFNISFRYSYVELIVLRDR